MPPINYNSYAGFGTWAGADQAWVQNLQKKTMDAYRPAGSKQVVYPTRYGQITKTLNRVPQFDTSYFKICDNEDPGMRLGLWNNQEDLLINLMRPTTTNVAERNITFIDFRSATDASTVRGSTDWCAIPTFPERPKLGKCVLRYCNDFDVHYEAVREALSPNDFAEKCYRDPIFDMDGRMISTEEEWLNAMLLMDMEESMHREIIDGVANNSTSFAKGLRKFLTDFATDHSAELAGNCSWIAPSVVATTLDAADVGAVLEKRFRELQFMTRDMRVQGTGRTMDVQMTDFVLVLSEKAAECVIKAHVCQEVCGATLSLQAMTPDQQREWKFIYPPYLTGGRFGQGYIVTPNGMVIDIIRSRRVADDELFFLYTGSAADPNGGIRLKMNDYTPYLAYLGRDGRNVASATMSLYGGSVMVIQSNDLCGNRYARWNWRLEDDRPYMQTLYTDLDLGDCDFPSTSGPANLPTATGQALNC